MMDIEKIFDSFKERNIFKEKSAIQSDYDPGNVFHRDNQIKQLALILAPVLGGNLSSNLFLYGKTGTGKTLSIKFVSKELLKHVEEDSDFKLKIVYLNCKLKKVSDTEYRILAELIRKLGGNVPDTGIPTQKVYDKFIRILDFEKTLTVIVLDEIDQTTKKLSYDFLYNLIRINSELSKGKVCLVGISNNLTFLDNIDPRVKSSLSEEEIVFPPYNALQLKDILSKRSDLVFKKGVIQLGVLEKCSALAAREHGDARRALDLLRIAGELAEREGSKKVLLKHVDQSNEKIDHDKVLDIIRTEPKQFQVVLKSIMNLDEKDPLNVFTGKVYNLYQELCNSNRLEILSQRRVGDIIQEFDMLGIINVNVISKGRGGRMRKINLVIDKNLLNEVRKIIENSLNYN